MIWLLLAVGAVGLIWGWRTSSPHHRRVLGFVAAGGLWFQAFHMAEHLVQAGVWVAARDRPPFLTPVAELGADTLEIVGHAGSGAELLHLAGNTLFLVGLLALAGLARSRRRSVTIALVIQGVHLLEHAALTLSVFVAGHAIGVTTLFGTLEPGPTLWSLRVLAHLGLNATATLFAAVAVIQFLRARSPDLLGGEEPTRPSARVSSG